jgi:Glycosyl transferase family 2
MKRASVLVCCEQDTFRNKGVDRFDAYLRQSVPLTDFEVIYTDRTARTSTETTIKRLQQTPQQLSIRYIPYETGGRASGNNLAAAHAQSNLLIFLADDFEPAPNFVEQHIRFHEMNRDSLAIAVGAGYFDETIRACAFARWIEDSGTIFGARMRERYAIWDQRFFYAGNASIKSELFETMNGFNPTFPIDAWDDYELGYRLATRGAYSRRIAADALHHHRVGFLERTHVLEATAGAAAIFETLHPSAAHPWKAMVGRAIDGGTLQTYPARRDALAKILDGSRRFSIEQLQATQRCLDEAFAIGYLNATAACD